MELPIAPCERLLKKTRLRVSNGASKEFAQLLEETAIDIVSEASAIAKSESRATVKREDIIRAKKKIFA
jgi:histone H3/H4